VKVLITTFGTRGDVQPYIALGQGLNQSGHQAAICTSEGYRPSVEERGIRYMHMDNELLRLTKAVLAETKGMGETIGLTRQMGPAMRRSMDDEWEAARAFEPDVIIYHPKCLGSLHVAEKLNIPAMLAIPLPFYTPTREFPVPFLANVRLGGGFNRFSFWLMGLSAGMFHNTIKDFRVRTLGMPPLGPFPNYLVRADGRPVPILYPYSRHVLPVPQDFPAHVHVTGYWFLDHAAGWQPDPKLENFLAAGPAPVYVGFGSVGGRGAQKRAMLALEALDKAGQRGLLSGGWGGWGDIKASDLPGDVLMLEDVPHDWLFPQVAAVVHHGGAGTTAAGLRAGKPSIICPFFGDQPFWGGLVHQLGVGPKPIHQYHLTVAGLSQAITTAVQDKAIQGRAAQLGAKIRAEDGVARAVEVVEAAVDKAVRA
jgi:sterol 3beta-glucosyltransferase